MKLNRLSRLAVLCGLVFLCACAKPSVTPVPGTHVPPDNLPQVGSTHPGIVPPPKPVPSRPAVVDAMISKAKKQLNQNRPDAAFRTLERALALDGRDPVIWHLMAKARLAQGAYAQAKSLAEKSNTLAAGNPGLRQKNRTIIDQANAKLSQI